MAYEGEGLDISIPAASDLSSYQYHFVQIDANGRVALTTAITDVPLGILQNKPSAADVPARIRVSGRSKLAMNQSCSEGTVVTSNTQGFGVPGGGTAAVGCFVRGITLLSCGGSGDITDVLLIDAYTGI